MTITIGGSGNGGSGITGDWPCVYGTPTTTGIINNPDISVYLTPHGSNYLSNTINVFMKNTAPSALQPKIGVTRISSVEWVTTSPTKHSFTAPNGNTEGYELGKLEAYGDGYRVFPESQTSSQVVPNNKVHAKVTLAAAVPAGMKGTVHLKSFDPDNPLGVDQNDQEGNDQNRPNDNYGELVDWYDVLVFDGSKAKRHTSHDSNTAAVQYYYGALCGSSNDTDVHVGDDFILAAHPNEGIVDNFRFKPSDGKTLEFQNSNGEWTTLDNGDPNHAHQTSVLTVWRTLNVECDVMKYYPGTTNSGTIITPPNPATFFGLAREELAKACVVINAILPSEPNYPTINVTQPPTGHNPMTEIEMLTIYGTSVVGSGRDIYGNSPEYWTVRIVMASEYENFGGFLPNYNTIVIYYETIKNEVNNVWNPGYPKETVTPASYTEHVILHEFCHLFWGWNDRQLLYSSYDDEFSIAGIPIDSSEVGVRDGTFRFVLGADPVPDLKNLITYTRLLPSDIFNIQNRSKPQD